VVGCSSSLLRYSLAEEVLSYYSFASGFVDSSAVPSQSVRIFCQLKELLKVDIVVVVEHFMCFYTVYQKKNVHLFNFLK